MLGRLKQYTNQTAVYERKTGNNAYGKAEYSEPIEIWARVEKKITLVRNSLGKEVASNTIVYTMQESKEDDRINGVTVLAVSSWVDKKGNPVGWAVFL